ncbi:hypothetical protein ACFWIJ_21915, partial [Streptomyces sp. NPDC127079]
GVGPPGRGARGGGGRGGAAGPPGAIGDTLTFVPSRDLPPLFKRRWGHVTVRGTLKHWRPRCTDAIADNRRILRGRRLR